MMAGGLALGVVGSRLAPPLIAMASGAIRGQAGQDPFERLIEEHRVILDTLHSMEAPGDSTAKRAVLFLKLKRRLARHAMAEEDVVHPLLADQAERRDAAKHRYEEHASMKILLFEIETALMRGEPWQDPVRRLREMIEGHAREEETEQFPRLRRALNARRYSEVAAQVRREEALIL